MKPFKFARDLHKPHLSSSMHLKFIQVWIKCFNFAFGQRPRRGRWPMLSHRGNFSSSFFFSSSSQPRPPGPADRRYLPGPWPPYQHGKLGRSPRHPTGRYLWYAGSEGQVSLFSCVLELEWSFWFSTNLEKFHNEGGEILLQKIQLVRVSKKRPKCSKSRGILFWE